MDKIVLYRTADGAHMVGCPHIVRHSPTGIEWGYGGSGPADCALSILTWAAEKLIGHKPPDCFQLAPKLYQQFKFDVIAKLPSAGGEVTLEQVRQWLEAQGVDLACSS